jgi:hypothetical protein
MHRVQANTRVAAPPRKIAVFWMFGTQRRFVLRFEWLTLCPNTAPLPQISQRFFKPASSSLPSVVASIFNGIAPGQ